MKKTIVMTLLVIAIAFATTSCATKAATYTKDAASKLNIQISFTLIGTNDEKMLDDKIKIVGENANLMEVMEWYFKDKNINFQNANGLVTTMKDLASDKENGWLLYINGEMAQVGASELILQDGDKAEWKYLNYAEAFSTN